MHTTQLHPTSGRCACGRDRQHAMPTRFSSVTGTYVHRRCVCGLEWTDHAAGMVPPEVTSSVDVAEVHAHFQAFHASLHEDPEPGRRLPAAVRTVAGSLRGHDVETTRRELQASLGQLLDVGRRLPGPLRRLAGS
jgi:hypothetical protein